MQRIRIEPAKRIDPNNVGQLIEGTNEQNLFCAFLALSVNPQVAVTVGQYFHVYRMLVSMVHDGIKVDHELQPILKGSRLLEEIHGLRGQDLDLLEASVLRSISEFLTQGNEEFCNAVVDELFKLEARLLVGSIFPTFQVQTN